MLNMYIYCNNNPISYIDSTGKTLRKAVTAICMVSEGSHRIPDVGNGNYSNFEEEYMEIAVPTINSVITRSQANQYYDTIKAGDYSQMINPLDCFDLFSYFDEMKGADYVEIWFNFLSNRPQSNNQNVYDPNGRLLYLEEGYTVITIHRVFIGGGYSATETEYFIFDQRMELQFNDVISNSYITD